MSSCRATNAKAERDEAVGVLRGFVEFMQCADVDFDDETDEAEDELRKAVTFLAQVTP